MAHDVNQSEMDAAAQVRSALVQRISSERCDLWIPENTNWRMSDDVLTLTFPSDFTCQLAKKMLAGEIVDAAQHIIGSSAKVTFQVDEQLAGGATTTGAVAPRDAKPSKTPSTPRAPATEEAVTGDTTAPLRQSPAETVSLRVKETSVGPGESLWDNFAQGKSNQLAWTTANLIVSEPGRLTPVLLHGPSGCGKSYLASAIAQQLRITRRMPRVVHMTSEQFTNGFTEGLRGGGLPMFRRKYRDVEALILDDVHFFMGKKSTLAELRHTLDNLLRLGKQVVFTSDRSLNELEPLGSELVGRLRGGLISPLFPLDERTRYELLTREFAAAGIELDDAVVEQIASRTAGDGRVLSGVVNRLTAVAALHSEKLGWEQIWNAVFDLIQATQPVVRIGDIERVVCSMFGLEPDSLQSPSKMRSVSQPRMLAMFLARKYTPAAYKEIGDYFGRRRHSTVISAEKTVEGWLSGNSSLQVGKGLTVRDAIRHVESQLQVG